MDKKELDFEQLCKEYTIKLLELQRVKLNASDNIKPSEEKKCELELIEKSIKYLKK